MSKWVGRFNDGSGVKGIDSVYSHKKKKEKKLYAVLEICRRWKKCAFETNNQ